MDEVLDIVYWVLSFSGVEQDVKKICKCAEMIQNCTKNLVSSSGRDLQKLRQPVSDENTDDMSILSDSQIEQLEFTSQDVLLSLTTLTESVQKVLEQERQALLAATRGKRLLPSQPVTNGAKNLLNRSVS